MKAKFYFLLLTLICSSFIVSAQEFVFNTMTIEDWVNSVWKKTGRITNTYNNDGILIQQDTELWDTITSAWIKQSIMTNTLNANSTIAESLTKRWDPDLKTWIDYMKMQFTYNASKKILTGTTSMDFGTGWMVFSKSTHEYDSNNLLIKRTDQGINIITMLLENNTLTTYTYNADFTENQSIVQIWSSSSTSWVNKYRITNSYNASKKVTTVLTEEYLTSAWVNKSKEIYTYNSDGTFKEILDQTWNSVSASWDNDSKNIYTINSNHGIDMIVSQDWVTGTSQWINDGKVTFTYTTTGIESRLLPDQQSVSVYPNPFTGEINIENSLANSIRFGIYNSTGQLVYSSATRETKTRVNLNSLGKGTYFLIMNSGNNEQTLKLVKIR